MTENQHLRIHLVRHALKVTIPQKTDTLEQTLLIDRLPQTDARKESVPTNKGSKKFRCEYSSCSRNFKLQTPRLHSGALCDRPETIETSKPLTIAKVLWKQPPEKSINQNNFKSFTIDSTTQYTQEAQMTNVASQKSPPMGIRPQIDVIATE